MANTENKKYKTTVETQAKISTDNTDVSGFLAVHSLLGLAFEIHHHNNL